MIITLTWKRGVKCSNSPISKHEDTTIYLYFLNICVSNPYEYVHWNTIDIWKKLK